MMKLHWSPKSPYVRKVMVCAIELGLEGQIDKLRSVAVNAEVILTHLPAWSPK